MEGISPNGDSSDVKGVKFGDFVLGSVFLTVYMLGIYIWIALFLNNMDFTDRYTHLSPFLGSSFRHTARYGWEWGFIYAMFFMNVLMGYFFAAAICNNSHPLWAKVHRWWCSLTMIANFVIFVALAVMWLFFCNTGYSQGSPCNNAQWCCDHRLDQPEWCQNTIACPGDVSRSRSDEFFATFMYSWVLIIVAWAHKSLNKYLWSQGMFMST